MCIVRAVECLLFRLLLLYMSVGAPRVGFGIVVMVEMMKRERFRVVSLNE